jgi:hypothetical protein
VLISQKPRNFIASTEKKITNNYLKENNKSESESFAIFRRNFASSLHIHILTMAWKGLKMALHLGLGAEGGLKKAICSASNSTGISPTSDLGTRSHYSLVLWVRIVLMPIRIRIQLPKIMRIRIELPKIMRIRIWIRILNTGSHQDAVKRIGSPDGYLFEGLYN